MVGGKGRIFDKRKEASTLILTAILFFL